MKTTKTVTSASCDLCGKAMTSGEEFNSVSETSPFGILSMKYDIWYGGTHQVEDVCKDCNSKVMGFLHKEKLLHGQKQKA
jgi:hypothetical protein